MEHRLAQYVKDHNEQETPAHSLIVDTDDRDIRKLFDDEEWKNILDLVPKSSDPHTVLSDYLDLFYNVNHPYIYSFRLYILTVR